MQPKDRHAEFERLYLEEKLTLQEIGERFGVSRQAVHDALTRRGVTMRPRSVPRTPTMAEVVKERIDVGELVRRYTVERRPVYKLAEDLGISLVLIRQILVSEGIEIRPRGYPGCQRPLRKTPFDSLSVGESIVIDDPTLKLPYTRLYELGKKRNMRLSIRNIAPNRFRITRVS